MDEAKLRVVKLRDMASETETRHEKPETKRTLVTAGDPDELYPVPTDLNVDEDMPQTRLVPHDYEGFCREVEIYGAWRSDLEKAARVFGQLKLL